MLVIGHYGQSGAHAEGTLAAFRDGIQSGIDMIECSIRLTHDNVPVVLHDRTLKRTHGVAISVSTHSLAELQEHAVGQPIVTFEELLDAFFGKIIINIEIKTRGSARIVNDIIATHAQQSQSKWDNMLVSSYFASELVAFRRINKQANLALLHDNNPFAFIAYHRLVDFTAVGFHRLHTNQLALQIAKKAKLFTYTYTVNRPQAARLLEAQGFDGIVTTQPRVVIDRK